MLYWLGFGVSMSDCAVVRLCSMLVQDNEDRLTLAMHDGFYTLCTGALDIANKYSSNNTPEAEKMIIEVMLTLGGRWVMLLWAIIEG